MRVLSFILVLAFPVAALADITGSTTLTAGAAGADNSLNLDTGKSGTSGGDIVWAGSSIAPVGKAKLKNLGMIFAVEPPSYYAEQAADATTTPIQGSQLTILDQFVVLTNGGNTAKVEVLGILNAGVGGARITLSFTTYVGIGPGTPIVDGILNNSSRIPSTYPNYGISPSSLFVITGAFLADPGDPVLQSTASPGLPLSLNGAGITVTVNGVTVHPALYYTSPGQLAAVLPASTPIGDGTLTVTYNNKTSPPFPIHVVPAALGINTYGGNVGVATDASSGAVLTYANSGSPGELIVLWATGLGADPNDSDTTFTTSPHSVDTPLQIYIGNALADIRYHGASVYPGVNQINVVIPATAMTGCFVPMTAIAGGVASNTVLLPIAQGGGACFDPISGLHGDQLPVAGTQTLKGGSVALIETPAGGSTPGVVNVATGSFQKYVGVYPNSRPGPGGCELLQPGPTVDFSGLDVGTITLTGPNNLNVKLAPQLGIKGAFYSMLAADAIPASGGSFTFTGSGGTDVGSFTATLPFSTPLFTWTNSAAVTTINRSQGVDVTWKGGNPGSLVYISGDVTYNKTAIGFSCTEKVEAGHFTVPTYILMALPAGSGSIGMENQFSVPLVASGLDGATAIGDVTVASVNATYQ